MTFPWRSIRARLALVGTALLLVGLVGAAVAHAQQPPASAPAAAQDAFVPFRPGDGGVEVLPATPFVLIAYAFVWVALLGYVLFLAVRLKRVQDELASVTARLDKEDRR